MYHEMFVASRLVDVPKGFTGQNFGIAVVFRPLQPDDKNNPFSFPEFPVSAPILTEFGLPSTGLTGAGVLY
jgi:hypothetical protein